MQNDSFIMKTFFALSAKILLNQSLPLAGKPTPVPSYIYGSLFYAKQTIMRSMTEIVFEFHVRRICSRL